MTQDQVRTLIRDQLRTKFAVWCTNHSSVTFWIDNVNDSHVFNLPSIYGQKHNYKFIKWLFQSLNRFPKRLIRFLLIAICYVFIWLAHSYWYIVCIYIGDTGWVARYRNNLHVHSFAQIPPLLYRPLVYPVGFGDQFINVPWLLT